jgi:YbbR domain-containing protein
MILAVIISAGLWLYVVNVENPSGSAHLRDIPVDVQGEDELEAKGLMVTELSQDTLDLKVTGKKKTLMRLTKSNTDLILDVSSINEAGEWTISCRTQFPSTVSSDSVSVSDWNDLKVVVTVEQRESKWIPVRGEFTGEESEGCLAGEITTDPDQVQITGPAARLDSVAYALVQATGEEVSDTLVVHAPVVLIGTDGEPVDDPTITCSTDTVEITVPVCQVVSVPLIVDFLDGGGATAADIDYTITPSSVTVVAQEGVIPDAIYLGQIDLAKVFDDTSYSLPIQVPEGMTKWGGADYASVTVTMNGLVSKLLPVREITLENIPAGYTAELASDTLYVWVRGEASAVSRATPGRIGVSVDVSKAKTGTTTLQRIPVTLTLQEEMEGVGIIGTSYSVAIRLAKE